MGDAVEDTSSNVGVVANGAKDEETAGEGTTASTGEYAAATEGFGSSLTAEALEQWYEATEFVSVQNAQVVKGVLYEVCGNGQVGIARRSMMETTLR